MAEEEEYSLSEFEENDEEISDASYEKSDVDEEEDNEPKFNLYEKQRSFPDTKIKEIFHQDYRGSENFIHDDDDVDLDDDNKEITYHKAPEILLVNLHRECENYMDFNSLKVNKIKCIALCKIVFGENHAKTAEAHLQLAEVYLKGKLYSKQALKHSNISRDILLFIQNHGNSVASFDLQYLLQNLYLVMGKANIQQQKYKVAENCLQKAKLVAESTNIATNNFISKRVEILSALGNTVSKLGKFGQGMEYIEEAMESVSKMPSQCKNLTIKLYKQIVELEMLNGEHTNFTLASESVKKALDISLEVNGHDSRDTAEILTMACRLEALKEDSNYNEVEDKLKQALTIYISIEEHEKQLSIQKMHSKILMQQEKFVEAETSLEMAIGKCEEIYGDSSIQSADLFELMGNIHFSLGKMPNALSYFIKAVEIYSQRKKYIKKQERMEKIIEMIRKSSKDEKLKSSRDKLRERPYFM